ncbi:MAG: hypothetical protein COC04_03075, partial [Gammaproteobacteria bacterium]
SYQDLWGELANIRQSNTRSEFASVSIPKRYQHSAKTKPPFIEPYQLFNRYPTSQLDLHNGAIVWNKGFSYEWMKKLFNTKILQSPLDAPYQAYQTLYEKLQNGSHHNISDLLSGQSKSAQLDLLKCISRCLKLGMLNYRVVQNHQE